MNQQRFTEVFNQLTPRRKEVLEKFLAGETDAAIAQSLHIQETTVRKHIEEICRHFDLDNDKLPGEHRPKRENLIRLFAKYKRELLSQRDVKEIATEEETALKYTSVERVEGVIAELPPENEPDKLVEKARSHSAVVPQRQEQAQEETVSKNPDFVGREEAIAESTPDNELDELVRRVREKRYSKIQDQCSTLRILDVEQEIGTHDLYIDINVLAEIPCYKHKGLPELLQNLNPDEIDRFGLGKRLERVPGLKAVEQHGKLMMLGQPGAGKTTFLQHIAIECNQGRFQGNYVPIFIRLREFTEDAKDAGDFSLFNYISHEFGCCRISQPDETLTKLLDDGRALILLDGLDEVPERHREEVLRQIRKFVNSSRNQFIISCRIAEGLSRFKNFTNVEVADFTLEQIDQFARKWFITFAKQSKCNEQEGLRKATEFMEKLNENNRIQELAVTPLLLTFICLVFQHKDDFPTKRSELYEEGLSILLNKWDKDRGIERDEIYHDLSQYYKTKLFSYVASVTFAQPPYYLFEKRIVQRHIADYLGKLPNANPNMEELLFHSEAVLQAIGIQHGLLIPRSKTIYSFSHRTFQEYFTARSIVTSSDQQALKQLLKNIANPRWREVFLLITEMLPNADDLLEQMKQQVDRMLDSEGNDNLQKFLQWVREKPVPCNPCFRPKPAAVRAFYLARVLDFNFDFQRHDTFLLASSIAEPCSVDTCSLSKSCRIHKALYKCSIYKALSEDVYGIRTQMYKSTLENNLADSLKLLCFFVRDLTSEGKIAMMIDNDMYWKLFNLLKHLRNQLPQEEDKLVEWWKSKGSDWTEKLKLAIIEYRNLDHNCQFSKAQKELLKQYYDANQLLMDCLNSDCEVTPEVQSHIEDTLLLPIAEIEKRRLGD
jgi:hypothetical protein